MTVRTALITGSGGGIGSVLCREFRRAGFFVVGTDVGATDIEADALIQADLAKFTRERDYRDGILAGIRSVIPGNTLTVLINNAAVQILGATRDLTEAAWRDTLDVNVLAPFLLTQQLLPELERARGSVVNISSIHAELTKPAFVGYAISKAALIGLTRSLAVDLGGRIRVNAICPAAIDTPMLKAGFAGRAEKLDELGSMHPAGRIGTAEDVARSALFLADPDNQFLTGAVLGLHGGLGCRLHDPV